MRILNSKAKNLLKISSKIKKAKIPIFYHFSVKDWKVNQRKILAHIEKIGLSKKQLIVRSSSVNEDNINFSNAGKYLSLSNINYKDLTDSINQVIKSYNKNLYNEIIVQEFISNIAFAGVAFNKDQKNGSDYKVINIAKGKDTSKVTSGKKTDTFFIYGNLKKTNNHEINLIIDFINEIDEIYNNKPLDIEFGFSKINHKKYKIWLFQIRSLKIINKISIEKDLKFYLDNIYKKITHSIKNPFLEGNKTMYGVMPDWNPAEIIGLYPKNLALSLYQELITKNIWAYQRSNYGYKNLRSFPLLINFYGLPFIDVRVSFNSFIPNKLDKKISIKLVNYYLNKLRKSPIHHDKIEFEIVFSCYTANLKKKLRNIKKNIFNTKEKNEIFKSLVRITNDITETKNGLMQKDFEKISLLIKNREKILKSDLTLIDKIYWIIEDTKRNGTLPFAGLARSGFVAIQILNSLLEENLINKKDYNLFFGSIRTITNQLQSDKIKLSKSQFLKKYGHLRPGTYDIEKDSYSDNPEKYFDWKKNEDNSSNSSAFNLSNLKKLNINRLLKKDGVNLSCNELFKFIKNAIEYREYSKFEFTKNISITLDLIKEYLHKIKINKKDYSFLDIEILLKSFNDLNIDSEYIEKSINYNREKYKISKSLNLPSLIIKPSDIYYHCVQNYKPTYITEKKIIGELKSNLRQNISDCIVLIENADPGYDWIFSHNIKGFITAWGGSNSHMAIRANELQIPALIGCGQEQFNYLLNAKILNLNCINQSYSILE